MSRRYWQLPGLALTPERSPALRLLAMLVLALAVLALWHSALHWIVSAAASLVLALVAVAAWYRRTPCFAGRTIRRLRCDNGCWQVEVYRRGIGEPGATFAMHPLADSVVLPWLVVLRMQVVPVNRTLTLVLGADGFSVECWRRLQLNLRQTLSTGSG